MNLGRSALCDPESGPGFVSLTIFPPGPPRHGVGLDPETPPRCPSLVFRFRVAPPVIWTLFSLILLVMLRAKPEVICSRLKSCPPINTFPTILPYRVSLSVIDGDSFADHQAGQMFPRSLAVGGCPCLGALFLCNRIKCRTLLLSSPPRIAVDDSNDTASEGFRMTSDGGREEKTEAEYPDHVFCNRNISVIIPRKAGRKAARSLLT